MAQWYSKGFHSADTIWGRNDYGTGVHIESRKLHNECELSPDFLKATKSCCSDHFLFMPCLTYDPILRLKVTKTGGPFSLMIAPLDDSFFTRTTRDGFSMPSLQPLTCRSECFHYQI